MSPSAERPAHARLVDEIFERRNAWDRVRTRLDQYPNIAAAFPMDTLREAGSPPYYVHPIAWRLGVWQSDRADGHFANLDRLLGLAWTLGGWVAELSRARRQPDFGAYWTLLWQLQVAALLVERGARVSWNPSKGPDLRAAIEGVDSYVECYVPLGTFEAFHFVNELLNQVSALWREEDLPTNCFITAQPRTDRLVALDKRRVNDYLHRLFDALSSSSARRTLMDRARLRRPFKLLPESCDALGFVVQIDHPDAPIVTESVSSCMDPKIMLESCLPRFANRKSEKNQLEKKRPNALLVNLLLVPQAHLAFSPDLRPTGYYLPELSELPMALDLLGFGVCGIDEPRASLRLRIAGESAGAIREVLRADTEVPQ